MKTKKYLIRLISVAAILLIWQVAAALSSSFLFPTPVSVLKKLIEVLSVGETYKKMGVTFLSLGGGFLSGLVVGAALAVPAARFKALEDALWPFMLTVRSVPVVSFIVLAYLYMSSQNIPVLISFLIVLPVVYNNLLAGIKSEDRRLSEMARVFSLSAGRRFLYITLPQIKPYLISSCQTGIGLAFKSGVAAEVITLAAGTIGEQIYSGKLYFDAEALFAWTIILVVLCYLFEWLFTFALKKIFKGLERL